MIGKPLTDEIDTMIEARAALSPAALVAVAKVRVGGASLSSTVTVATGITPRVAPTGGSMTTTTDSFGSSIASSINERVTVVEVLPGGKLTSVDDAV